MSDDLSDLRTLAHPLRLRMLSLLTGTAMSAAEVARDLEITHANASYHLRLLARRGLLAVESEEQIRGGMAKRYRHVWDERPTLALTRGQVDTMAGELVRRFGQRHTDESATLTDAELWVTPHVWDRVRALVIEASELVHAQAQAPRSEGAVPVNLTVAAFRLRP